MKAAQRFASTLFVIGVGMALTIPCAALASSDEQVAQAKPAPADKVASIQLTTLDAEQVVPILKKMFEKGGPFIEADIWNNRIIVRGSREQIAAIKDALWPQDGEPQRITMRVITLEKGDAAATAELLKRVVTQLRPNPVRVVVAGKPEPPPPKSTPQLKGDAKPLLDPTEQRDPSKPLTITAFGNRLALTCDDPKTLALAAALARGLAPPPEEPDAEYVLIRLRHARAAEVAQTLDYVFNGPKKSKSNDKSAPRSERIRVIIDPGVNGLLLRANPLDTATIRRLVERTLDVPPPEPTGKKKPQP